MYFLLTGLIGLTSCKPCRSPEHKRLGPESLTYFGSQKNGSWWVFERKSDRARDSVYLTNYSRQTERPIDINVCYDLEAVRYQLVGKGVLCQRSIVTIDARGSIDQVNFVDNGINNPLFYFSLYTANNQGFERGPYADFERLTSYTVNGVSYPNVTKVYAKAPQYNRSGAMTYVVWRTLYITPEVGLIRAEYIPTSQGGVRETYDLIKYSIVH
ncbi:hypothetical protein J2I47_17875 [Fibrella sp. HMF5335]|uniref:Uncharacterized protein n=1 Tax=Fibrella rubiginis TaxID=2817060 RepID=A0A939K7A8_9BACT|nr:hypothetical protein [Fibrella rubiginis]MBO0938425.1 hypothetical protein [Fibrella rubiginis]